MTSFSDAAANAAADAVVARVNGGTLRIYAGTPPANVRTALSGNTLLAELTFGTPAYGAAVAGVATANAIGQDAANDATGTPTFYRAFASGGTAELQGTAGAADADLILSGLVGGQIIQGGTTAVTSLTYTQPRE
jgi:hypothetical protein